MWKTELTVELAGDLIQAAGLLSHRRLALLYFVLPETLEGWLDRGSRIDADEPFRTLAAGIHQKDSQTVYEALADMEGGRRKDPKMALLFLHERFPDEFGPGKKSPHDSILEGAKRGSKIAAVRKFLKSPDAEFLAVALEAGLLERLQALSAPSETAPDPASTATADRSTGPEATDDDRPIDGPPRGKRPARRAPQS